MLVEAAIEKVKEQITTHRASKTTTGTSVFDTEASVSADKDKLYARDPRSGASKVRAADILKKGESTVVLRRMSLEEAGEGSMRSTPVVIPFPLERDLDVKSDEPEGDEHELTEDENDVQVVLPSIPPPVRSMVTIVIKAAEVAGEACSGMAGQEVVDLLEVSEKDMAALVNILETTGEMGLMGPPSSVPAVGFGGGSVVGHGGGSVVGHGGGSAVGSGGGSMEMSGFGRGITTPRGGGDSVGRNGSVTSSTPVDQPLW